MKIVGTIQARMGSTRLPGKVMKYVAGRPLLAWQLARLKRSRLLDDVIVATTTNQLDDEIVNYCKDQGVLCYRGSEDDVLGRLANVVREFGFDVHVEFFGDSPLADFHIVDEMIGQYLKNKDEFVCVCNSLKTTYPPGLEVIVHRAALLIEADNEVAKDDPLREHVSVHITKNKDVKTLNIEAPQYYHFPEMYLEVDTEKDFVVISNIIEHFCQAGKSYFSLEQIIDYLFSNPDILCLNQNEERRWKEFRNDS